MWHHLLLFYDVELGPFLVDDLLVLLAIHIGDKAGVG